VLRATAQVGLSEVQIDRVLAGGVIEGKPTDTIRRLREDLERIHGETVEINGRDYQVRDYASLVVRTKTRQASEVARHERLEELDIDLVSIIGRISAHFCSAFLGEVFSISGKSSQYAALSELPGGGPPFHPNCSKSTRPYIASMASGKQARMAEGLEDADKLIGMTPVEAQRSYRDLQLQAQVRGHYATTARELFGE
jgi:hypothetical protein